jgi:sigma-B regulation protein RsbU (phosphoserine phosphatase)
MIGEQMVVQATITAHLVALAEEHGIDVTDINTHLSEVAHDTILDEIWVTDRAGHAYLRSRPEVDFTFSPDPAKQPQAHVFYPLLLGEERVVVQAAQTREIDDRVFKYVAVSGVDMPRIVQVGYEVEFIESLRERTGIESLLEQLVMVPGINAISTFDDGLDPMASKTAPDFEMSERPDETESRLLREVIASGSTRSELAGGVLKVMAPIQTMDGAVKGATLVYFSLDHVEAVLARNMQLAIGVAIIVLLTGLIASSMLGRRLARPVEEVTAAAEAFERRMFLPEVLADVRRRKDELGNFARVFTKMAAEIQTETDKLDRQVAERTHELHEKNASLERALNQLDDELAMAQQTQLSLLPRHCPKRAEVDLYAQMIAAREVSGDFYDTFDIDDRRLGIIIADVSGKGVPAALFMAVAYTVLKALAQQGGSPGEVLASLNDRLCDGNDQAMFVTVIYGVFDTETGVFTYANGGHNAPFLVRQGTNVERLAATGGVAVGVMEHLPYAEAKVQLRPGDTIFFYTDGFAEAFDASGHEFTEDRLAAVLAQCGRYSVSNIATGMVNSVKDFAGPQSQLDDMTCVVLRYLGAAPAGELRQAVSPSRSELTVRIVNDVADIPGLATLVESFGRQNDLPARSVHDVNLALEELLTNTISYGYDDDRSHAIEVRLRRRGDTLTIELIDDANPFNPLEAETPATDAPLEDRPIGGLGIHLARSVLTSLDYSREGSHNHLTLTKRIDA